MPLMLAACNDKQQDPEKPASYVRVQTIAFVDHVPTASISGQIEARIETALSFRVSGRITERLVDVGSHVKAGDVLARMDPQEQKADIVAAEASVSAAQGQVTQLTANLNRQKELLNKGVGTRSDVDGAEASFRTAQSSLQAAQASLETAHETLGYTVLKADADGIITARDAEAGQVAQAAQQIFTLAHDGPRDAVFQFYEAAFDKGGVTENTDIRISLINRPDVQAMGRIREISPTVDAATGTVRLKVGLDTLPAEMMLGAAVTGTQELTPVKVAMLPWMAMTADGGAPAVWIMDPQSRKISLRKVTVFSYEKETALISAGLDAGSVVVVDGTKTLRPNQVVTLLEEASQ